MRSFYSYLVDSGYIEKNPTNLVDSLPPEHKEITGFDHKDAKVLLDAAGKHKHSNYWVPMILFGWHYGMRISDCSHLTHEEVDMARRQITFLPKKQRRRYIKLPLHSDVHDALCRSSLTLCVQGPR